MTYYYDTGILEVNHKCAFNVMNQTGNGNGKSNFSFSASIYAYQIDDLN